MSGTMTFSPSLTLMVERERTVVTLETATEWFRGEVKYEAK